MNQLEFLKPLVEVLPCNTDSSYILRDYQQFLINQIYESWKKYDRLLLQLPTGGGKTVCFAAIVKYFLDNGQRVLVLAHREELIYQSQQKIELIANVSTGLIKAGKPTNYEAACQIGQVQTACRRKNLPYADLVIIDECFPSNVLVDNKPISSYRVGDYVTAFGQRKRFAT